MSAARWIRGGKLHACGNDFIVIAPESVSVGSRPALTRAICDPHFGVGADGCLFLEPLSEDHFQLKICNRDGSEAEMSGNGARCAAAFLHFTGVVAGDEIIFETLAGKKRYLRVSSQDLHWRYRSSMGMPSFSASDIPFSAPSTPRRISDFEISIGDENVCITALSVGNPQCVVFVETLPGTSETERLGRSLGTHPYFPEGTNVSFVRVVDRNRIEIRIWERGVGSTHSSGTGSCGAAVAALAAAKVRSPVEVQTETGLQLVSWSSGMEIELAGDVNFIADLRYHFPG